MRSGSSIAALLAGALLIAGCGSSSSSSSATSSASSSTAASTAAAQTTAPAPGKVGPEGIVLETGAPLGSASSTLPGTTIDGIQCAPLEQLAYHIHAHLQVYVNGQPRQLPAAIGILGLVVQQTPAGPFYGASKCIYWLHTHTTDGIIHIESPTQRIYTLGDFFDEWHQPLAATQVASASGKVTAFLNGKPWTGSLRSIPLNPHAQVQLDVGSPTVAYRPISFGGSGL
jgi:hypothetical protein